MSDFMCELPKVVIFNDQQLAACGSSYGMHKCRGGCVGLLKVVIFNGQQLAACGSSYGMHKCRGGCVGAAEGCDF